MSESSHIHDKQLFLYGLSHLSANFLRMFSSFECQLSWITFGVMLTISESVVFYSEEFDDIQLAVFHKKKLDLGLPDCLLFTIKGQIRIL